MSKKENIFLKILIKITQCRFCIKSMAHVQHGKLFMRKNLMALAGALLAGYAGAQVPDAEPQVTAEVTEVLTRIAAGETPQERFTERGAATTLASGTAARQLHSCPAPSLRLMDRQVKGEDRLYLYRVDCGMESWYLEIDYNKAARINRLALRPAR